MPAGVIKPVQLTKLATELEVLLRNGSPLGPGLRIASHRWSGPLGPAAEKLALSLDSGVTVDEAFRSAPELPTVFRALAAASMGTNRGDDVLEAWTDSTRQLLDLRERLLRGLMYPFIVVTMAYGLFVMMVRNVLPQMAEIVTEFSESPPWWAGVVERLHATLPIWSWAVPLGLFVVWLVLHFVLGRHNAAGWWGHLPGVQGALRDIHASTASRLLSALLECEVPLPLALSLASESLSTKWARDGVNAVAEDIRRGVPAEKSFRSRAGAPPLWRAFFVRDVEPAAVRSGLIHVSEVLAERARNRIELLGRVIPLVLIIVLGGLTVFGYGVVVFGPLISVWNGIGGAP